MNTYCLSVGSNISPEIYIPQSIEVLRSRFPNIKFSSIYKTAPVGPAGDDVFWNYGAILDTNHSQDDLVKILREIEETLGRERDPKNKYKARTIDIDVLPQPGYEKEAFIICPLAEISPLDVEPVTQKSYKDLAENLDQSCILEVLSVSVD